MSSFEHKIITISKQHRFVIEEKHNPCGAYIEIFLQKKGVFKWKDLYTERINIDATTDEVYEMYNFPDGRWTWIHVKFFDLRTITEQIKQRFSLV